MTLEVERSKIHGIRRTDADGDKGLIRAVEEGYVNDDAFTMVVANDVHLTRDETRQLGELLIRVADEGWGS